jgi:hypothetical protein
MTMSRQVPRDRRVAVTIPALAEHLVEDNLKTPDIPGVKKPEALSDEQAVLILQVVAAGVMAGFEEFPMESALAQLNQPEAAHTLGVNRVLPNEEVEKLPYPTAAPEVEKLSYPAAATVEETVGEVFASEYTEPVLLIPASPAATPEQFKQEMENRRNKRRREIDRELESVGDERLRGCLKDVFAIGERAGKDLMARILEDNRKPHKSFANRDGHVYAAARGSSAIVFTGTSGRLPLMLSHLSPPLFTTRSSVIIVANY